MKFALGLVVGTLVGPRLYGIVAVRYGHVIIPYLQGTLKKVQEWKPEGTTT